MLSFQVIAKDGHARLGRLQTKHGAIDTPAFVPVATRGTVTAMAPVDLQTVGSQVVIANTYHLHIQPGESVIENLGGLHRFMHWDRPLMTDSGGFQIFSLGAGKIHGVGKIASIFPEEKIGGNKPTDSKKVRSDPLATVNQDGASFVSYLDHTIHRFTPERAIKVQKSLGADIIFVLDECTSPLHDRSYTEKAMENTHQWALRALSSHRKDPRRQGLFGIVQGGVYEDLRKASAQFIAEQEFDGFAIGGSLGKSKKDMHDVLHWTIQEFPEDKPRHLLGIGDVDDVFHIVKAGIDLFDCVVPTRLAKTGTVFARHEKRGRLHVTNARFKDDDSPIDGDCPCLTCQTSSRAYLRHLFMAHEPLGIQLAAMHNLFFMESLMRNIRSAISNGTFHQLHQEYTY